LGAARLVALGNEGKFRYAAPLSARKQEDEMDRKTR
jgi:hypothetical protein